MATMADPTITINLAADYGWGPYTLLWIFTVALLVATVGFLIVMATTRAKKKVSFATKRKHHFEAFWAAGVAGVLVWLWVTSYPWMPPVAFSKVITNSSISQKDLQVVQITGGQWFWLMSQAEAAGDKYGNNSTSSSSGSFISPSFNPGEGQGFRHDVHVEIATGKPVKFIAHSVDVNHGLGIFKGTDDGAPILLQMQVIPGEDNVFYYTFREPGTYFIRCLEYCGYAHPYMTSSLKVVVG